MEENKKYSIEEIYIVAGKELTDKFRGNLRDGEVERWFSTPNRELDGKIPYEIFLRQDEKYIGRIEQAIVMLDEGIHN
ncbi:MAG: hypothetical protein AABY14_02165 [Nanoarchaeota archaeon]